MNELTHKNSWLNNLLQVRVKILRPAKRKTIFLKNQFLSTLKQTNKASKADSYKKIPTYPGDIVKVRSKDEIRSTLDEHEKYMGCFFIDEMYEHCNKAYHILKNVDYFYDEARQKICRCRDMVILEGVVCSGRQRLYTESCDRSCFFFWHKDWLEKQPQE